MHTFSITVPPIAIDDAKPVSAVTVPVPSDSNAPVGQGAPCGLEGGAHVTEIVVVPRPAAHSMVLSPPLSPNVISGVVPLPPVCGKLVQPENVTVPEGPVPFAWPQDARPVPAAAAGPANAAVATPAMSKATMVRTVRAEYLFMPYLPSGPVVRRLWRRYSVILIAR